ncbi:uncharacterized protein [Amphiura filiformis]|uniref:uncharacterized protein n=1 Tax=Amphiura filiformis TaxID=82378 RepID=UPI003B21C460
MIVDAGRNKTDANFSLDGDFIEEVESFEFLGSIINTKSDCTQEIKRRLAIARGVVSNLTKLWKSKLPSSLKVRLLKSTAFAVASYGSESWTMKLSDRKRLDSFELWCYRRILRIPWTARKTNEWVLQELGVQKTLRADIISRKLSYFGHITRHHCLQKTIVQGMVEGKRKRGRPAASWLNDINEMDMPTSNTKPTQAIMTGDPGQKREFDPITPLL